MRSRSLGAFLLALPVATGSLLAFGAKNTGARAASAYANWSGVNGPDVVVDFGGGDCPVMVTDETLTFYIDDLPITQEEAEKSTSRVEASYTLENRTAEDVALTMYLPVGFKPDYLSELRGGYSVTVDGEPLDIVNGGEIRERFTYHEKNYYGTAFDLDGELPRKDMMQDDFFYAEQEVTVYTFSVTVPEDGSDLRTFIFRYDANPSRTQVFSAGSGVVGVNNGRGEVYRNVKTGQTQEIVIYAIGDVPKRVEAGVYSMSGANAQPIAGAHVGQPEKRRIDFSAFVREMYADAGTSVSCLDFYNATVAMLSADSDLRLTSRIDAAAVLENLMLWYEYEVTVPANGSIVNTVTAPLMPDIPSENTGKWSFDYLLSPGQRWADFRAITINIQTPFCLESSTLNFSKTQSGYTFSKDGLPLGELSFVVARKEGMGYEPQPVDGGTPTLTTALIMLGVAVGAAVVVVVVVLCVHARTRKKMREEEEKLKRGRAENGKIDLDPFPDLGGSDGDKKNDKADGQGKRQ